MPRRRVDTLNFAHPAKRASAVLERQRMDGKVCAGVGPCGGGSPSRSARQGRKVFERVFIAVLGVNRLSRAEFDGASGHPDLLTLLADEMHLHSVGLAVVRRWVAGSFQF